MDILESLMQPDMLFLACGAGCLGLGAALVKVYRDYSSGTLKHRLLLAAATASLASGPILIARGW